MFFKMFSEISSKFQAATFSPPSGWHQHVPSCIYMSRLTRQILQLSSKPDKLTVKLAVASSETHSASSGNHA